MSRFLHFLLFFCFLLILQCSVLCAYEFLYPVAYTKRNDQIGVYVLYQKSITHLELWFWNPKTKIATKGLLSTYMPAGLKILPSNNGFSFIDEGRIRIKEFHKRSPKTIDIYESLYDINEIEWINKDNCYFSARINGLLSIFQINMNGLLQCLIADSTHDCMYPQIAGDSLFFVERQVKDEIPKMEHISYKVCESIYMPNFLTKNIIEKKVREGLLSGDILFDENYIDYEKAQKKKRYSIIDFQDTPIAFLKMISDHEGFFLTHPDEIERQDKIVTFDCYYMLKKKNAWHYRDIFSFSVPSYLLFDLLDSRLYESILPLLPKYYKGKIYYVDYYPLKKGNSNVYSYSIATDTVEQKTFGRNNQLSFNPIFIENTMLYGGNINQACVSSPRMWIDEEDNVCIDLPSVVIS